MHLKTLVAAAGIALAGCGGGGSIDPSPTTVIAKASGDAQDGIVGRPLAQPIQVLVTENNAPLAGAIVTWLPVFPEPIFNPASGPTDADGLASTVWTLSPQGTGTHTVTATVSGASTASVNFTATAAPDVPVALAEITGDNQSAMVNTPLRHIVARVEDQFGNGVAGVGVSWSVSSGTISPEEAVTGPGGLSSAQVILGGMAGPVTITVTSDDLTGSPLTFNATAEPTPTEAAVRLGNIFFTSDRNSSTNPAVDTIAVGGVVTWTWGNTGIAEHSVRSLGTPSFTSSDTKLGNGQNYSFTFTTAGTYSYDCAVHGSQMTGRVLVR